jgi:CMP-N,N'-diacetyllegionaminic acid synthase
MIEGDRVLAVIAARGGSKGLPGKNLRDLGGKPLIAWSIEAARQSRYIDRAIVSTDDSEIADVARRWAGDVPFLRPAELATDEAPIIASLLHAADTVAERYRYVVLLQATAPFRLGSDIDAALELCRAQGAPACVSVTPAPKARWLQEIDATGHLVALFQNNGSRRQELGLAYQPNGAVYAAEIEWLRRQANFYTLETLGYVMPPERSVDIDTIWDFYSAEAILRAAGKS